MVIVVLYNLRTFSNIEFSLLANFASLTAAFTRRRFGTTFWTDYLLTALLTHNRPSLMFATAALF